MRRSRSAAWAAASPERSASSQAAAPATTGAAKLVPSRRAKPSGVPSVSSATGTAAITPSPGAARSTAPFEVEKSLLAPVGPMLETDTTCGKAAGNMTGLTVPSGSTVKRSLPAAATTSTSWEIA